MAEQAETIDELNEVIAILRGGASFYREAAERVKNAQLASLFRENADKREAVADDLASEVTDRGGEAREGGDWGAKLRSLYSRALTVLSDPDETFVANLEEMEDRTLAEMRDAICEIEEGDVARARLEGHLSVIEKSHKQMAVLNSGA